MERIMMLLQIILVGMLSLTLGSKYRKEGETTLAWIYAAIGFISCGNLVIWLSIYLRR